jgi:thioester reductase-like protein
VGIRNLLKVALTMPHAARLRFLFASSFASLQSWELSLGEVREDASVESKFAVGIGYGEAKHVAERVSSC